MKQTTGINNLVPPYVFCDICLLPSLVFNILNKTSLFIILLNRFVRDWNVFVLAKIYLHKYLVPCTLATILPSVLDSKLVSICFNTGPDFVLQSLVQASDLVPGPVL